MGGFLCQNDGGGDALIAAARQIGAVHPGDNRHTSLIQCGIAVQQRTAAVSSREDVLLPIQLDAGAVEQAYQRDTQTLGGIGGAEHILRLAGHPCARQLLVVRRGDDHPFAAHLAQPLHHAGGASFVAVGVKQAVQRQERPLIYQLFDALHGAELPLFVEGGGRLTAVQNILPLLSNGVLHLFQCGAVRVVRRCQWLADGGHMLEIPGHSVASHGVTPFVTFPEMWGYAFRGRHEQPRSCPPFPTERRFEFPPDARHRPWPVPWR